MRENWQSKRVKDLGRVITGKTPPTKDKSNFGSGYPFIKPPDLSKDTRSVLVTETEITTIGLSTLPDKLVPENTVCVVCIGTIGEKIGLTTCPSITNQQINSVIVNESEHDPLFVYYLLRDALPQLKQLNAGSASGRENVNITAFSNMEVVAPSYATQQKIATILSTYDDLIENNLRRIKILEEMAQNLYREWFVKFRFPGHDQVRMVDSPLGKIPEGWEATVLGDLADQIRRGVSPDSLDPTTPYVGLEHIPRKSVALTEWGAVGEVKSTKLKFEENEILFGKIRPYFHKVAVAPLDGVCSSDTIVIKPRSSDVWSLVLGCASSEAFVAHATQTSQGTKMPRANWDVLIEYALPLPPRYLRNQFNQTMESSYRLMRNLIFKNNNLRQTRDLLLPKLISGELDLSELDIDIKTKAA